MLETFIIMEFCDQKTLESKLKVAWGLLLKNPEAGMRWILSCLLEIAMAMEYLHSLGLVHGDLKANNVLLQSTRSNARGFTCKVADLGCCRLLSTARTVRKELCTGTYGAPRYASPELLRDGSLTQVSDGVSFTYAPISCEFENFKMN